MSGGGEAGDVKAAAVENTGDADVQMPAPLPLYKYVPIENLRRILDGSIRFTQPSAFNDPFELLPEIIIPLGEAERQISVSFDIMAPRGAVSDAAAEVIPEGCVSSDPMSRDIVQQLNRLIGILSLSRVRDSLLMWSHYADQYAGAVVEFDGTHDFFAGQTDVEYRPTRPRRHVSGYLAEAPIPVAQLCVKPDQWAYEEEVRVIRPLAECEERVQGGRGYPVFVKPVPLSAIKSVIMGERTPVEALREIFGRVKDTHIALSLAAVSHSGYSFREERIKFAVPVSQMMPMVSPRTAHIFSGGDGQFAELARWMAERHPMSRIVNRPV